MQSTPLRRLVCPVAEGFPRPPFGLDDGMRGAPGRSLRTLSAPPEAVAAAVAGASSQCGAGERVRPRADGRVAPGLPARPPVPPMFPQRTPLTADTRGRREAGAIGERARGPRRSGGAKAEREESKRRAKRTAGGIRIWSPTILLVSRFAA